MRMDLDLIDNERVPPPSNRRSERLNLTPKAKRILAYIAAYEARWGTGPDLDEIHAGTATPIQIKLSRYPDTRLVLGRLIDHGYIKFHYRKYRTVQP